jgi:transposase
MGRPYSADLRSLVIREVTAGSSARAAAVHFRLGVSTAIRWVERHRRTGSAAALPIPGRRSPLEAHRDWLLGLVRQTSELTLVKIQVRLLEEKGVSSAIGSIWRFYNRNDYSFKKSSFMPPSRSARMSSKPVRPGA